MLDKIQKDVKSAYRDVTGEEPVNNGNIIVTVDDNIKVGKIGSFTHPTNKEDLGVMKIHPKALENIDYTEDVLKHETIHSVCGLDPKCRKHKGIFQPIANKVKLPNEYRH